MKKYILLTFLGIATIATNAQILDVPMVRQERSLWCWAAVSQSVLGYYGHLFSQCEIAEYARTVSTMINFGTVNCCAPNSPSCNQTNYNWLHRGSIQDILVHFGGISNDGLTRPLTTFEIHNNLNANRPFIVAFRSLVGGDGHAVVSNGRTLFLTYYMDPALAVVGGDYQFATHSDFMNNGRREWIETNVMLVSPTSIGTDIPHIATNTAINIFPNPVKDELIIESGELIIKRIDILDINGKTIYRFDGSRNQISVSTLARGTYFVRIETDKGIETQKFIKE